MLPVQLVTVELIAQFVWFTLGTVSIRHWRGRGVPHRSCCHCGRNGASMPRLHYPCLVLAHSSHGWALSTVLACSCHLSIALLSLLLLRSRASSSILFYCFAPTAWPEERRRSSPLRRHRGSPLGTAPSRPVTVRLSGCLAEVEPLRSGDGENSLIPYSYWCHSFVVFGHPWCSVLCKLFCFFSYISF